MPTEVPLLGTMDADTGTTRGHAPKISLAEAQGLVDSGLAEWLLKRGKYALKMKRATSPQLLSVRGTSCRMGQRVIEAFAFEGKFRSAVASWQVNHQGLQCAI